MLTLNNPAQLNAIVPSMMPDLLTGLDALELDKSIRAIVLTGAGRGFCSGADLSGDRLAASGSGIADQIRDGLNRVILRLRKSHLPVVTAVNGPAAGAGVGLALAGDFVLAARSAKFVLSFVKIGAALDGGASYHLPRLIGPVRARQMAMLGEPVDAERALRWGLIWHMSENGEVLSDAMVLAQKLAAGPSSALAGIKHALELGWRTALAESLELEATLQGAAFASADLKEGVRAFQEKRPPRFGTD
jgi:enoyl-CoA hydratase/carnithine racemase